MVDSFWGTVVLCCRKNTRLAGDLNLEEGVNTRLAGDLEVGDTDLYRNGVSCTDLYLYMLGNGAYNFMNCFSCTEYSTIEVTLRELFYLLCLGEGVPSNFLELIASKVSFLLCILRRFLLRLQIIFYSVSTECRRLIYDSRHYFS